MAGSSCLACGFVEFLIRPTQRPKNMGRKGKTQKHTAKEIAGKTKAAREKNGAAGHGGQGMAARLAVMKAKDVVCQGELVINCFFLSSLMSFSPSFTGTHSLCVAPSFAKFFVCFL